MSNDTTVIEARNRMMPILIDTMEIDYRKGGLSALEMAASNLEDALKGLNTAIKELDDQRFAKAWIVGEVDKSIAKIADLDSQIRGAITPELLRKAGGM